MKRFKCLRMLLAVVALAGLLGLASGQAAAEVVLYDEGGIVLTNDFVLDGRSWLPDTDLSYSFINFTPDLTMAKVRAAIELALGFWSAVTPLTFTELPDTGLPFNDPAAEEPNAGNIRIQFGAGDHGDPFPFDGVSGVLAHAFLPPPNGITAAGDAHFDEDETWTDQDRPTGGQPIDLRTVGAHEFGHSLGLSHAQSAFCPAPSGVSSLMCPFYTGSHNFLAQDDVNGIQAIYGAGAGIAGTVSGLASKAICKNKVTAQRVKNPFTPPNWDCSGLSTTSGDTVLVTLKGKSNGSAISGTVTGLNPVTKVRCKNRTTGAKATGTASPNWNCGSLPLPTSGDKVQIKIKGSAQ